MMKRTICFIWAFVVFSLTPAVYAVSDDGEDNGYEGDIYYSDALDATIPISLQLDLSPEFEVYTVEEGDNLFRIALAHDVPLESIVAWNDLENYVIYPGDELKLDGEEVTDKKVEFVASSSIPASQPVVQAKEKANAPATEEVVKEMTVTATAYTAYCEGCSGTTAYGIDLRANPNRKVIAVDPRVIPLGTKVWVEGYGEAIAGDTGGAIKGNKIDVFIPSQQNAIAWGVKTVKLRVLN